MTKDRTLTIGKGTYGAGALLGYFQSFTEQTNRANVK